MHKNSFVRFLSLVRGISKSIKASTSLWKVRYGRVVFTSYITSEVSECHQARWRCPLQRSLVKQKPKAYQSEVTLPLPIPSPRLEPTCEHCVKSKIVCGRLLKWLSQCQVGFSELDQPIIYSCMALARDHDVMSNREHMLVTFEQVPHSPLSTPTLANHF